MKTVLLIAVEVLKAVLPFIGRKARAKRKALLEEIQGEA